MHDSLVGESSVLLYMAGGPLKEMAALGFYAFRDGERWKILRLCKLVT